MWAAWNDDHPRAALGDNGILHRLFWNQPIVAPVEREDGTAQRPEIVSDIHVRHRPETRRPQGPRRSSGRSRRFARQFGIAIGANQYGIPDLGGRRHGVDVCRPPNEPAGPRIFDERRRKHDALDLLAKLLRDANRNRTGKQLAEQENLPLANRIADKLGISGIPQCRVWRIANDAYVQIFRKKWRDPVK